MYVNLTQGNFRTNTVFKKLAIILLAFSVLLSYMPLVSAAGEGVSFTIPSSDASELSKVVSKMTNDKKNEIEQADGTGSTSGIIKVSGSTVTFNKAAFENGTPSAQKEFLRAYVNGINDSKMSKSAKRKAVNGLQDASGTANKMLIPMVIDDSSADVYAGYQATKGAQPMIKNIFGILVWIILYGLILSTVLDLIYAGFPFARNFGNGKDGGDSKPAWVSADMYTAVRDAESGESYSNVYLKYLLRRAWTYILLVLCIVYLAVGEMGSLISGIMSLGDGFLQADAE